MLVGGFNHMSTSLLLLKAVVQPLSPRYASRTGFYPYAPLTTCRMFVPCAHQRLNSKLAIMSTTHKTRRTGEVSNGAYIFTHNVVTKKTLAGQFQA